ncbi:MAG: hypothetical protein ACRDNH_00785 [Gaiellaceae bacterium]
MRRRKRHITGWVALGLAVAATVPVTAQARLEPYASTHQVRPPTELGLSEGKIRALGLLEQGGMKSADDRSFPTVVTDGYRQLMELGLSEGKIRTLGLLEQTRSPDDRSFSRATNVDPTPVVVSDGGRTIDLNAYTVSGFGIALLCAMAVGMGIVAVWHSRGAKLSAA